MFQTQGRRAAAAIRLSDIAASYILPIRRTAFGEVSELTSYLRWLDARLELIVVDGSRPEVFAQHSQAWRGLRHFSPRPGLWTRNGKVWGVLTGLELASNERIAIADDDVRYDEKSLGRVLSLLEGADVIRPQNYFDPIPWHAKWDTARTLLNRVTGGDWPGTLAVKRSVLMRTDGYNGDCLFENLELVRTVRAAGGRECVALNVFVRRLPPTKRHFLSQRVRQAYDEFARPWRLAFQLALLPSILPHAPQEAGLPRRCRISVDRSCRVRKTARWRRSRFSCFRFAVGARLAGRARRLQLARRLQPSSVWRRSLRRRRDSEGRDGAAGAREAQAGPRPAAPASCAVTNPFLSAEAVKNSSYGRPEDAHLLFRESHHAPRMAEEVHAALRAVLHDPDFPCVGAKSVVNQSSYRFGLYPELASVASTCGLAFDLYQFIEERPRLDGDFSSFIASFVEPKVKSMARFEKLLWQQLKALHDLDKAYHEWNEDVSGDPQDPRFSMSFAGKAFFVVGLAPPNPRWARCFPWPTLVFNDHFQFERLREEQRFDHLRDTKLHGSVNPMLTDYGAHSEARQYSGRSVSGHWACPVHFD